MGKGWWEVVDFSRKLILNICDHDKMWIWEFTTWGHCLGVWKLNVGNGMKNEPTTRWKEPNIRHMHEVDIKGQFTLFS
jgi:hypothetical protein